MSVIYDPISIRDAFGNALLEMVRKNDKIFAIGADITKSMGLKPIMREFPDRVINIGMPNKTGFIRSWRRSQDRRMEFPKAVVPAEEIFKPLEQLFASRCEDIGIAFRVEDTIWNLPPLYTNASRLTQLLEILLDNAFKFVPDDGWISISSTTKYAQATIRVADNGCGITDEMLPHIFERFYKSTVNNPTGSGLGLAIAKEIITGLEEKIWVRTEVNKGTTFFFTVPLHK